MAHSATHSIPWHRRLEARVLFCVLLIAGLSMGALLVAATRIVTGYSLRRSQDDMDAAQRAFRRLAFSRAESAAEQCRLIAELPIFRSLLTDARVLSERDAVTVSAMAEDYRRKLDADFCLVTDGSGRWLGRLRDVEGETARAVLEGAVRAARRGEGYRGVLALEGGLYLVVSEPARFAEEVLGTLTAGYRLDDELAAELARVTRCEVSFVSGSRLCGSSLGRARQAEVATLLAGPQERLAAWDRRPSLQRLGRETYVGGIYPLFRPADAGRLLLLHPWQPTQQVLDEVQGALLYVGAVAFLLSLGTGLILSRRVARSLREIAAVAEEVAAGDWDRQAPVQGSAEAAMMATAFNRMTGNLRHYYEEARLQSDRRAEALEQLRQSYRDTLEALSRALDTRDNETEGHSQRVTHFALCLGREMGLDSETRTTLELGALLHDIGKIGIPDAILRKPGRLTDDEMREMQRHCAMGVDIVRDIPHLQRASDVIRYHHERYDGRGYPHGLAGEEIPLVARVFAVADTLDALTSDRPYRSACSFQEALAEIQRCSGSQFDPHVVEALAGILDDLQHWRRFGAAVSSQQSAVGGQQPQAVSRAVAGR